MGNEQRVDQHAISNVNLTEERQTGFEPVITAWKAVVLPLHHCRISMSNSQ